MTRLKIQREVPVHIWLKITYIELVRVMIHTHTHAHCIIELRIVNSGWNKETVCFITVQEGSREIQTSSLT